MRRLVIPFLLLVFLGAAVWWRTKSQPLSPESSTLLPPLEELLPTASEPQSVRLIFGGDLMFDRHIRLHMNTNGVDWPLQPLTETFLQYDAVVANLEGPITDFPSRSVGSVVGSTNNFIFTFSPAITPMLKANNLTILNLGNNHILNFGEQGMAQTRQYLLAEGLEFFGNTSLETQPSERVLIMEMNGITLAFTNYNQFVGGGWEAALQDVAYADPRADLVIVMPHWGNEYEPIANAVVQNWAHQLIDEGADLIIGGHPHVVQQSEEYQGKTIYYSLGNFVFDQYFEPAVQQGLLVGVEIQPDLSMTFTEIPIQLNRNGQTTLIPQ